MNEGSFLQKNRNGRGRHRNQESPETHSGFDAISLDSESEETTEVISFTLQPLSKRAVDFIRNEIPSDIDLDSTDIPPDLLWVLSKVGLRVIKRDRIDGSHATLSDGINEHRLLHSEIVTMLRNHLAEQEAEAKRIAELQKEIEAIDKELPASEHSKAVTESQSLDMEPQVDSASLPDIEIPTEIRSPFTATKTDRAEQEAANIDTSVLDVNLDEPFAGTGDDDPFEALRREYGQPPVSTEKPADPLLNVQREMDAQRGKTREELARITFDNRFSEQFGITPEDLVKIDGFERLSSPQQKLLFENLSQSVYGRMQKEAAEHIRNSGTSGASGNFVRKAWTGMYEALTKDARYFSTLKELGKDYKNAGFEEHRPVLEFLVRSMVHTGPRVHEDPHTGELLVDIVQREWTRAERDREWVAVQGLNEAAHAFAKIPTDWKEETLGVTEGKRNEGKLASWVKNVFSRERKQGNEYAHKEAAFIEAKNAFAAALKEGGVPDTEILRQLISIDARVKQLQFVQTSPDAIEKLSTIEDMSVWRKAAGSLIRNKGGYFALGFVGRSVLGPLMGFIAAPVVSSAIAGMRSWNKTAAELRERDRLARMGVEDTSSEALTMVTVESLIHKTELLLNTYAALDGRRRQAYEAGNIAEQEQIEKEIHLVLSKLRSRVKFIEDKEGLQRINYGSGEYAYAHHAYLLELLGHSSIIVANEDAPEREKLEARLAGFLARKDEEVRSRRNKYRYADMRNHMITAVGFSVAGATLAHIMHEGFNSSTAARSTEASVPHHEMRGPALPPQETISPSVSDTVGESLPSEYTIQRGDSLLKIIAAHELKSPDGTPWKEEDALRILKSLSKDQLARVGIASGDINKIYAGKALNIEELNTLLLEHKDALSPKGTNSSPEPFGDFRGAEHELNSDSLNRDSIIREGTIPEYSGSDFSNEYPSGEQASVEKTLAKVDFLTEQKAKILQTYFVHKYIPKEHWETVKGMSAEAYMRKMHENTIASPVMVKSMFEQVGKKPMSLVPEKSETVEKFMARIFTKLTILSNEAGVPKDLKKLFEAIEKRST